MATLTSNYSLVEQAKRVDPDGKLSIIVEALDFETGQVLQEADWLPSNDIWTNKTVIRGSLPTGSRRKLNSGVAKEVSRVTEALDTIEMLETYAEYDKDWIDSLPNPQMARMQEARAFLMGLGQTLVSSFLYSNANVDADRMHGLAGRLAKLDGEYVIGAGGTGSDLTSIFVVTWGPDFSYFVYPKNQGNLGIKHTDLGEVTISDATTAVASTSQYQGYRDHFQVKAGFVVRHPKAIGRICNIESSGSANIFDEDDLITLLNNMKITPRTRIYCNQTVKTQAEIALKDKTNVNWTQENGLDGIPFMKFRQIPVRMIDKSILLNTESAVS